MRGILAGLWLIWAAAPLAAQSWHEPPRGSATRGALMEAVARRALLLLAYLNGQNRACAAWVCATGKSHALEPGKIAVIRR